MDAKKIGTFAILTACVLWAIEPIVAKLAYHNSNIVQTVTIRLIVGAVIAALYVLFTNKANFKVEKTKISKLIYLALLGSVVCDLLYLYALTKVPVIDVVLIAHMQPVFIILIGFFILKKERLTKLDYFGIFIMLIAGIMVTTKTIPNLLSFKIGTKGDLLVLIATFLWATCAIVMRRYLKEMNAGVISFYRLSIAAAVLTIYLAVTSSFFISNIYQIIMGLIIGVGTILYYEGLKRMKAAQVSALELSTPFFAATLGFFILGQILTVMQIVGMFILVFGVYLLSKRESRISASKK